MSQIPTNDYKIRNGQGALESIYCTSERSTVDCQNALGQVLIETSAAIKVADVDNSAFPGALILTESQDGVHKLH